MRLIESKAEYIPQEEGLEGVYKMIELAGRTAYHSQDKITPDSAKDFVDRMIKSKHGAALEHGTVYLKVTLPEDEITPKESLYHYKRNPYSIYKVINRIAYVTSNFRVLQENNWLDDLQYLCSPIVFHEKRYTMRFTCSRAIANELVRHRVFSFLQESTRYINYSKERHGGEITFIAPSWYNGILIEENKGVKLYDDYERWTNSNWIHVYCKDVSSKWFFKNCLESEYCYFHMLNDDNTKLTPQQARDVLPNATKTELIMTGFASDWARLFELRLYESTGKVAPDMKVLMQKAWKEFENYGITRDLERYIKL